MASSPAGSGGTRWRAVAAVVLAAGSAGLLGCAVEQATAPALAPLFTLAVIADTHIAGEPEHEDRLGAMVAWLDEHAAERNIELVVVLGDIGWGDRLERSKELLDELTIPYVPLIGDNEIAAGDEQAFTELFAPQLAKLAGELGHWRQAPAPIWDPEADRDVWLQNMAFEHAGVQFFALDWCVRSEVGIMAEFGDLHDFPGGSWPWLEQQLAETAPFVSQSVVLLSHIPMFLGSLQHEEIDELAAGLAPFDDAIHANIAGHLHGDLQMAGPGFDVYAIDAVWDDENTVRLVEVSGNAERFAYRHEVVVVP